jgi:drug/metabolite transporter (DMT)-like permease
LPRDFQLTAALYALISAFLFALTNHFQSLGLRGADARSGSLVNIASGTVMYWLIAPFFLESWYWLTWACALFVLVGLFRPSLSSVMALSSIQYMGPTLTSALTAVAPIFGAAYALLLLGEQLTLRIALGTLAVILGCVLSTYRRQGLARGWPLWALVLPLGAAFVRASGHVGTKLGLEQVPSPSFAVLVSNTVSLVLVAIVFRIEGRPFSGTLQSHAWFILGGMAAGLSLHFLNSALQIGTLVSVVPIVSASPVFTLLLGLYVFRREIIGWQTLAAIALVVPGVILVVLG